MEKCLFDVATKANSLWPKDYIIRYLYRHLAPCFSFYPDYFYSSKEEQMDLYKKGFSLDLPYIVCISLCKYYKQIFDEFGIESQIILATTPTDYSVPLYSLIVKGDNNWFYIDPLYDLMNNQLGINSNAFGHISSLANDRITKEYPIIKELSLPYIHFLDRELGIDSINDRFESKAYDLKNRYKIEHSLPRGSSISDIIESKINIVLNDFINNGNVPGPVERNRMYVYFMRQLFTLKERQNLVLRPSDKENGYAPELFDTTTKAVYREFKEEDKYIIRKLQK